MPKISGYLKDGAAKAVADCDIILYALKTSNDVIEQIESCTTAKDGFYEINALAGQYEVILSITGRPPKKVGVIRVYNNSPNGTLNDFLVMPNNSEASPTFITAVTELRNQTVQAKNQAEKAKNDAIQTLNNTVKKTGGTLSGNIVFNGAPKGILFSPSGHKIFGGVNDFEFQMNDVNNTNLARLAWRKGQSRWDFINSSVTIDGASILKQGDGGIYDKSPLLAANTNFSSNIVTSRNQIFTLSGKYIGTPDDSVIWGGVLEVKRRLYDASTACILTLSYGNRIYIKEGYKTGTNWLWGNWRKLLDDQQYRVLDMPATGSGDKWALLASGIAAGQNAANITLLVTGTSNYGGKYNAVDIVSFSSRSNGGVKVTNLSSAETKGSRYGWRINSDNDKYELWIKIPPYIMGGRVTQLNHPHDSLQVKLAEKIEYQTAEPTGIKYVEPEIVLKKGDHGLGGTLLPFLSDFKSLSIENGLYFALGSSVSSPTLNAPPDSGNSTLTVAVRNRSKNVTHFEVIENHKTAPIKWIGEYYIGRSNVIWTKVITTADSTIDANGFYKKASPIVRLINPDSQSAIDECIEDNLQNVDGGFTNEQASGVVVKYLTTGHYEIHGSLGFAKSGWYIETPQDANGNKKLFVEYSTDENNVITVKSYENCFDNGRFVAGKPMNVPDGRWIDIRLTMPEKTAEPDIQPSE